MSTDYPAQILNHDGSEIEMEGRINFTDPTNAPGGSLPEGWSQAGDPANVDTEGGGLTIGAGGFLEVIDGGLDIDDGGITVAGGGVTVQADGVTITDDSDLVMGGGDVNTGGGGVNTGGGDLGAGGTAPATVFGVNFQFTGSGQLGPGLYDAGTGINFFGGALSPQLVLDPTTATAEDVANVLLAFGLIRAS